MVLFSDIPKMKTDNSEIFNVKNQECVVSPQNHLFGEVGGYINWTNLIKFENIYKKTEPPCYRFYEQREIAQRGLCAFISQR